MIKNSRRISNSSQGTESADLDGPRPSGTPLLADPWKHYSLRGLLYEALRLYILSLPQTLPLAAAILVLAIGVGAAGALAALRELESFPISSAIASGVRMAVFTMLLLTPFSAARGLRIVIRRATGRDIRFPGVRWYRLVGATVYLAIPLGIVVLAFPLGVVGLLFYVLWMFAPHAVLVEADGGRTALRRSRTLFQGEFSATALPATIVFVAALVALAMSHNLVPGPPRGGFVLDKDRDMFVRELSEGDLYDPETRILTPADGNPIALHDVAYDPDARTLTRPAPPPVPATTALLWAGIPLLVAGLLDPIRWLTQGLLYINLRSRREGLTLELLLEEMSSEDTG